MEKEILVYGDINSYSAVEFITSMNDSADDDITVRVATDGGDPEYGFGMIAKFSEHAKGKNIKVDGKAYSMGTFLCVYADNVECLNVSQFLVHRAAYSKWFESDPQFFTDALKTNLKIVNDNLKQAFINKVDVEKFEKLKGVTIDQIFSMDDRLDVFLTASEAKKIGLVDSIINITPKKKSEIAAKMKMAAKHTPNKNAQLEIPAEQNDNIMTYEELKAAHPEIFAKAVNAGVEQERDRVGSWLPYFGADPELVSASIKDGKTVSHTIREEMHVKMFAANSLKAIQAANPKAVVTAEVPAGAQGADAEKLAKEEAVKSFRNEARASLNLPVLK